MLHPLGGGGQPGHQCRNRPAAAALPTLAASIPALQKAAPAGEQRCVSGASPIVVVWRSTQVDGCCATTAGRLLLVPQPSPSMHCWILPSPHLAVARQCLGVWGPPRGRGSREEAKAGLARHLACAVCAGPRCKGRGEGVGPRGAARLHQDGWAVLSAGGGCVAADGDRDVRAASGAGRACVVKGRGWGAATCQGIAIGAAAGWGAALPGVKAMQLAVQRAAADCAARLASLQHPARRCWRCTRACGLGRSLRG